MDSIYMMIQAIITIFIMFSAIVIPCYLYHQKMVKRIEKEERKKFN